jgi:glycosyltransferase involved in cell wall biosynthesis
MTMAPSDETQSLSILTLDPFHGGSHRQFTEALANKSRHQWHAVTGKPVHWKWRMRSAPIAFANKTRELVQQLGYPDVLFCTDMLDLPVYLGLLGDPRIQQVSKVLYFHENQWTYPVSPTKRVDNHFGYTNLLSAIAADEVWFNSQFHLRDFIRGSRNFLKQMPDTRELHHLEALEEKSRIIPPGFSIPENLPAQSSISANKSDTDTEPEITIGWVSRWEYDKCPEEFVTLLGMLTAAGIKFKLILLGARPRHPVPELKEILERYQHQILHDGFAKNLDAYWRLLAQMDVVISTANHEFFGIAICEAIWAGAVPIVPDRLSYTEHIPQSCRYKSLDDAVGLVARNSSSSTRIHQSTICKTQIAGLQTDRIVKKIDIHLSQLAGRSHG